VAAEFDQLASEAAVEGARVALEPMPADALMPTIHDALELVAAAGNPNGGLVIDSYHVARAATSYAELRAVPLDRVFGVEIADGRRDVVGSLFDDSSNERLFPGEGELEVAGFVRCLHELGYRGPWGVEILSARYRTWPVDEVLSRAHRMARETIAAAISGLASAEAGSDK
jgi:sugar phosphate isomerase/epimerase